MSRKKDRRPTCEHRAGRSGGDSLSTLDHKRTLPHAVFFVVVDQAVPAGMVMGGVMVPIGSVFAGMPLVGPLHSGGKARKAMLHARRNGFPWAYIVRYRSRTPHVGPFAPALVPPMKANARRQGGVAPASLDLSSVQFPRLRPSVNRRR